MSIIKFSSCNLRVFRRINVGNRIDLGKFIVLEKSCHVKDHRRRRIKNQCQIMLIEVGRFSSSENSHFIASEIDSCFLDSQSLTFRMEI